MTDLAPAGLDSKSDPASTYVAKRLSRRSAFRKAGALGLAGALLLGVGVGAGHAAGGGGSKSGGTSSAQKKDSGFSYSSLEVRGHGPEGQVSSMAVPLEDTDAGGALDFHVWELDGVTYAYTAEDNAVGHLGTGDYVPATSALSSEKNGPSGVIRTLTIDLWDHAASAEVASKELAAKPAETRERAAKHAAELNAELNAKEAAKAK